MRRPSIASPSRCGNPGRPLSGRTEAMRTRATLGGGENGRYLHPQDPSHGTHGFCFTSEAAQTDAMSAGSRRNRVVELDQEAADNTLIHDLFLTGACGPLALIV